MRSAAVVGACTAISRILGLVRQILMASAFGTSLAQSAFVVAFKIPNLFRAVFGEGALSAAFVPVFSETIEKEGRERAWRFASGALTLLATALAGLVLAVLLAATLAIEFLPPDGKAAAVMSLLRITFPYVFFICIVALCMGILNSFHHFVTPAATPIALNVVWILALLLVCPRLGIGLERRIYAVAWGVLVAGLIELLIQYPALRRFGWSPGLSFGWRDPRIRRVLTLMLPAAVGMGVFQINAVVDSLLALAISDWAPAALSFAELLVHLPLSLFGVSLGTVLLPTYSRQAAQMRPDEMLKTLNRSLRALFFVMTPAAAGLVLLAKPCVELLFRWKGGMFDAASALQAARALSFYASGLVAFGAYKVIVPAFYALQDTATPVRVGVRVVLLNFVLNVLFMLTWPQSYKHAGLAFATALASAVNCFALSALLSKRIGSPDWARIWGGAARILGATAVMGVAIWLLYPFMAGLADTMNLSFKLRQLLPLAGAVLGGVAAYLAAAAVLCPKEMKLVLGLRGGKRTTG